MTASARGAAAALIAVLLVWEAAAALFGVDPHTLPAPSAIAEAIADEREVLLPALAVTAGEAVAGLLAALVLGVVLGLLVAELRAAAIVLEPLLVLSQTVPVIALAPLLVTWLGFGALPKVLVVTLIAVFPVVVSVVTGVRQADAALRELVAGAGGGVWRRLRMVSFPAAVPAMLGGARIAALLVVPGAVAAELIGATDGLGRLLLIYDRDGRVVLTFACVALLAALGLALYAAVSGVERLLASRGLTPT